MQFFILSPFLHNLTALAVRLEHAVSANFLYDKYKNEIVHVHLIGELNGGVLNVFTFLKLELSAFSSGIHQTFNFSANSFKIISAHLNLLKRITAKVIKKFQNKKSI